MPSPRGCCYDGKEVSRIPSPRLATVHQLQHAAQWDLADLKHFSCLLHPISTIELLLLTDRSANQTATWDFLRRQLEHARKLAAVPSQASGAAQLACNIGSMIWQRYVPGRR
jgi:hypothetical protein